MEKKLQKINLTDYNLLRAQDLWQAHYRNSSIIFLKEFIKLNVNNAVDTNGGEGMGRGGREEE